jgi:hypothetical protein
MGDGRWEMGDGRWEMGDGRWEMGDGRWEMEVSYHRSSVIHTDSFQSSVTYHRSPVIRPFLESIENFTTNITEQPFIKYLENSFK